MRVIYHSKNRDSYLVLPPPKWYQFFLKRLIKLHDRYRIPYIIDDGEDKK